MEMNAAELDRVERHGQCVKRVRSVYDMHRVPLGAAENLEDLITALRHNRHFAMDFWALVGDLSAREQGALDDEEMLDVVVEGVTGLPVTSLPEQDGSVIRELRQMLAGVDIGSPAFLPDAIERPTDALISSGRRDHRRSATVVSLPERTRRPESNGTMRGGSPARRVEPVETMVARRTIGEALSRLEQTSMELREQLAAIEEQIETLPDAEAHHDAEAVAAELPATDQQRLETKDLPLEPWEGSVAEELIHRKPLREQETRPAWTPEPTMAATKMRGQEGVSARVLWPEEMEEPVLFASQPARTRPRRGLAIPDEDDDPSIAVPLAGYVQEDSDRSRGGRVALVVLLLLLLGGGGYAATHVDTVRGAWERTRPSLEASYAGFIEKLQVLKREATAKSSDVTPSGQEAAPASAPASAAAAPEAPASTPATANDGSGLDAKSAVSAPQASGAAAPTGTTGDAAGPAPKALTDRESDVARAKRDGSGDAAEPEIFDAGVVRVPAAVMEANLIASRVPAYPETAKAEGIEGRVVMEALISKNGTVEGVRVIEGDRHLRAAAEDAVRKWHYRPYLVSGRPVDVGTTVRVDFRLPRHMGR